MFSHRLGVSALILACLGSACAQAQRVDVEPITSALRAHDFDRAIELSRAALTRTPKNAQLWSLQGIAFASKGDRKRALQSFQQALKISPDYIAALAGAGQLYYQAGDRKGVPLLNRLVQLRPDDPTAHAMLAVLSYREGKCAAAVGHFEKGGALLESQRDAQHAYGICLVRLRRLDDAIKVFQHTVTLKPDDRHERQILASVQVMAKKPQDAIATLEPVLHADSPDASTLELASTAYEDAGETPRAVSSLRQAILLDPQDVNLYLDFASMCLAHQSFKVGIDVVSDGMRVQPNAAELYLARGVLYVQLADYQSAEADFERAHELDPNQSLSAAAQGLAALQQNDIGRALAEIQTKLAKKPNDAYLLYLQADFLTQKGVDPGTPEFQAALHSATKSVSLQPSLAPARAVLAKLYMQAGKLQDAIVESRKALEIDPKDQTSVYRLIQALRKTGKKEEIPALLKRLADLREQAAKEDRERYRYKLAGGESQAGEPARQ
ncbi:MAG TPA: tetratricopeptide repeat protein [Terriglobales bacterium]|nr:tetratricopeptide repeat protein [Terriglobales bacterium]